MDEQSPREPYDYTRHLFGDRTALLASVDEVLASRLGRAELRATVDQVPDAWLIEIDPHETPERVRARYHAFLWKRLKAPRPWIR